MTSTDASSIWFVLLLFTCTFGAASAVIIAMLCRIADALEKRKK